MLVAVVGISKTADRAVLLLFISSSPVLPQSLMQLCRVRIRRLVGIERLTRIRNLPERLIRFLKHDVQCEDTLYVRTKPHYHHADEA